MINSQLVVIIELFFVASINLVEHFFFPFASNNEVVPSDALGLLHVFEELILNYGAEKIAIVIEP